MNFSKRAKRGISAFSKIQWNPRRALYHMSQKTMIRLGADPKLVTAASEAMEILVKNGEKANADLQTVSDSENNAVPPSEEGRPVGDFPIQSDDHGQA